MKAIIEKIHVEKDLYENRGEPDIAAEFLKESDAQTFASQLATLSDTLADNFKSRLLP